MSVIGHWRRSVLGAGGVALLLPVALTVGVALTMALGGETTLRALGQVFAGPAPPGPLAAGLEGGPAVPAVPNRPRPRPRRGAASAGASGAPSTAAPGTAAPSGGDGPQAAAQPGAGAPQRPGTQKPERAPAPAPGPATPPPAPAEDPPAPAPAGSVVHEAGEGVADAVAGSPVPGGDAVQSVVDLIP